MKWRTLLNYFVILVLLNVAFYLGYLFALRESYNSQDNLQETVSGNGFIRNSITATDSRQVFGLLEDKPEVYGELLFKEVKDRTEIRLKLKNLPTNLKNPADPKATPPLPKNLSLKLAKICCEGLDFEETDVKATINLENQGSTLSADFSTILNLTFAQSRTSAIILDNAENKNIFKGTATENKDWPKNLLEKPAPYFWVKI